MTAEKSSSEYTSDTGMETKYRKQGFLVLIPWARNHRLRGEVKLSFQTLHSFRVQRYCQLCWWLPCKGICEGFSKKKKKHLIKKNPRHLIRFTAALFSWLLHMIFCLSPLLPVCSDGTVPTRKLDSPCCRDARCRMNTWTTRKKKKSSLQTLLTASKIRLHCRKHIKKKNQLQNQHQKTKKQLWLTFKKM